MKKMPYIFIWIGILFSPFSSFAQHKFRFKNISINQGLSQSTVSSIVEDSKGILWFSTFDGLNKYDGKNFKVFRAQGSSNLKLKASKINKLFLAQNNHLFIYTDGGIDIIDLKTENNIADSLSPKSKIFAPCIYNDSSIIFSDDSPFLKLYNDYTHKTTILHRFTSNQDSSNPLRKILKYNDGFILEYQKNRIEIIDKTGTLLEQFEINDILQEIQLVGNKLLVSARKKGVIEIDLKTKIITPYKHFLGILNVVRTMFIDDQLYAFSYGQGILKIDMQNKRISEIQNKILENTFITSSFQDKNKNVWIGTDGSGLNFFNRHQLIFDNITSSRLGSVRGIVQGGDKIYIATFSNGCFSYDINTRKTEQVFYNSNKTCNAIGYTDGKLWIGFDHSGLEIMDIASKKIVGAIPYFEKQLLEQFKSRIYKIDNIDENHMAISTRSEGIALVDKKTYKITKRIHQANTALKTSDIRHTILSNDGKKIFVASVFEGLVVFSYPTFKLIKNIRTDEKQVKISVKHVREDAKGNIWLGTNGSGIIVLNKNYKQIAHWNTQNILKNDVIYSTLAENDNALWSSSNEGLSRLQYELVNDTIKINDIQNFNINNGLQSNEFNTGAYCKTNRGYFAFGGLDNVNVFNPSLLKFDRKNREVRITDISVRNKTLQTEKVIYYIDEVHLKPSQNDIGLSFIVPGYNNGISIEYRYRLKGYQSTWQNIGNRNNIDFTNLPSGSYQFQVQSRYLNNLWQKDFTELNIIIKTPFYKSWWFYFLVILGSILLFGAFIQWRINYIKTVNKKKLRLMIESQEIERSRISQDLHDDFGARLSTLKLHMEAIKLQPAQAKEIAQNTTKIIDQSIVELRNILLNLSPKTLSDDGLEIALQEIVNSINKTNLLGVSSSYSINGELKSSAAISIYRVVFELINNTIKHAQATQIDISLTERKDAIVLHYEDNGIGTDTRNKSKGYGLSNIQNHLQVHDGISFIDSERGKGYYFTAEFPLNILS